MSGRTVRRAVFLLLLLIQAGATASGRGWSIDLSDPDPVALEDLPGILPEEVDLLRGVSGSGPGDLGERLVATGIPRERLRAWAPYLVVSASGVPALRSRWRSRIDGGAGAPLESTSRLRLSSRSLALEVAATRPLVPERGTEKREVRLAIRPGLRSVLWCGSITGGIQGANPWEDPLLRSGTGSSSPPRFRLRASRTATGLALRVRSIDLSAWRSRERSGGFLLAVTRPTRSLWIGQRRGRGKGLGAGYTIGAAELIASVHRPVRSATGIARIEIRPRGMSDRLALAWGGGAARLEGEVRRAVGPWRLRGSGAWLRGTGAYLAGGRHDRSRRRLGLQVAGPVAGARVVLNLKGEGRRGRLRLELAGRPGAGWRPRLAADARLAADVRRACLVDLTLERRRGGGTVTLRALARDSARISWPGLGAKVRAGRFALALRLTRAWARMRVGVDLFTAVRGGLPVRSGGMRWRFVLERTGGG